MKSKFLTVNARNFLHGLIVAAGAGAIMVLQPILSTGALPNSVNLKTASIAALAAGVAYIGKKLLQNSGGSFGPEKE